MVSTLTRPHRSDCPIASGLELFGDRWSLVVVRDMLTGKKRFGEFLQSPERITTNILSDRLVRLEHAGIVERRPRGPTSRRYDYLLTDKGEALLPVLQEICRWANAHLPDTWVPPESFMAARPAKGEPRR